MYNMARLLKRTGQIVESKSQTYSLVNNTLDEDVYLAILSGASNTARLTLPVQPAKDMRPVWVLCTDLSNATAVAYNGTALYTFTAANTATFYLWDGTTWRFMQHPTI